MQAFSRVLESLGVSDAAIILRERNFSDPGKVLDPKTFQAISFYFQLLNLVEEHGSGRSARQREKELGGDVEPGRWGRYLKQLKDAGFDDLMKNIDLFSEHTKMVIPAESQKTPFVVLRKVNRNNSTS